MKKRLRICLLLPASLFVGIMASEFSQVISTGGGNDSLQTYRGENGEARTEWLVGRSAAMAVSHSPFSDIDLERAE